MRIKRQRRKLRGKYSGNCLSCAAKWSKCWYIASTENQRAWEDRLRVVVTPVDDEVCFQCWDAKIRTSPKRKIHYKAELVPVDTEDPKPENDSTTTQPPLTSTKRAQRMRRACTLRVPELASDDKYSDSNSSDEEEKPIKKRKIGHPLNSSSSDIDQGSKDQSFSHLPEDKSGGRGTNTIPIMSERSIKSEIIEESFILDEENAVILLSTAFQTIPYPFPHSNILVNHNTYNPEDIDMSDDEFNQAKKRGAYSCGKCGKLKKGHACVSPGDSPTLTPLPSTSQCTTLQLLQLPPSPSTMPPPLPLPHPSFHVAVFSQFCENVFTKKVDSM